MEQAIETALDGGSGAVVTALDFLLQPLDYQEVEVARGSSFEYVLRFQNAGDAAIWKFETLEYDIAFSARFEDEQFHKATLLTADMCEDEQGIDGEDAPQGEGGEGSDEIDENDGRVEIFALERHTTAHLMAVSNSFSCTGPGMAILTWDNSYSWSRSKRLLFTAEVVSAATMAAAEQAAADIEFARRGAGSEKFRDDNDNNASPTPLLDVNALEGEESGGSTSVATTTFVGGGGGGGGGAGGAVGQIGLQLAQSILPLVPPVAGAVGHGVGLVAGTAKYLYAGAKWGIGMDSAADGEVQCLLIAADSSNSCSL
jgi:hypothetical protein